MALPPSGPISLNQVNTELGRPATQTIGLGDPAVRALAGVPSGPISMSNLYGKSSVTKLTIGASQTCLDLKAWALQNGWDGVAALEITINGGVELSSNNVNIPGLRVIGPFPGGITIYNNGLIAGCGGTGGAGGWGQIPPGDGREVGKSAVSGGGVGMALSQTTIIDNKGVIGGGGGAGGGGNGSFAKVLANRGSGGGGGGGGRASNNNQAPGGAGGPVVDGGYGGPGSPGGNGTANGGGGGGPSPGGDGGPGVFGGPGGDWGAAGSPAQGAGGSGSAAGAAIQTNGAFINWIDIGTVKGSIV